MRLPSEDEINIHNSLDEISASKHFLNKTLQEAEALFQENSAYYQEDLMWMGSQAFQFYLQAVINYLKSEHSLGDDHLIDCLYEIVVFRSQQDGFLVTRDRVKEMINYVIENYAKFDVDEDVYGDLLGKYRQLQSQLKE
ncbi:hypothetical protein NC981_09125 [Leptolyngbya sp. DQ-M1]|uniref:hypothetical protein n=1 Tax=Leptolyngbya sp. DQ-M1 TaxID=2933920 RepID=UPI003297E0B6